VDLGLNGKVVLVTGASGAIGAAIAHAFAAEGAEVAAGWHASEPAEEAFPVRLDHRDPASLTAAVDEVTRALGPIDVLVANAVAWPSREPDTWTGLADSLAANVAGPLALIEAALPGMRAAGWGRLVLISSDVVDQPIPAGSGYSAAKSALEGAARVLATREARHGILTNVVRPGFTLTERARTTFGQAAVDAEAAKTPTGRICTPQDVASAVAYLGSAANSHVNGEVLSVAGGRQLTR
jgi:NAD(P)-dependent dehydrogenase (short-subunit alcohol dehydrogenase family)